MLSDLEIPYILSDISQGDTTSIEKDQEADP